MWVLARFAENHRKSPEALRCNASGDFFDRSQIVVCTRSIFSLDFEQAIKLLLPVLQVGSRHLQLTCKALPRESDRAYAQINASWLDPRPTSEAAPEPPAATTAQVCVEIKNH